MKNIPIGISNFIQTLHDDCIYVDKTKEILSTLNGVEVNGVGRLEFNTQKISSSRSALNIGDNKSFTGTSLLLAVDISDIVAIVNSILGKPSISFNAAAADINGDGIINVADAVSLVDIILEE